MQKILMTMLFLFLGFCEFSCLGIMHPITVNAYRGLSVHEAEGLFTLNVYNTSLTIESNYGGRISSLALEGNEFLSSKSVHPKYYGSTLWMSPQAIWSVSRLQGVLDNSVYNTVVSDRSSLHLKSQNDSLSGFSFEKQFFGNAKDTSIRIRYIITNISEEKKKLAPWEVTRVPTGGLAFFPKGSQPPLQKSNLAIQDVQNFIWYPYDSSTVSKQKLFMNGGEGWLAYVKDEIILIKQFADINPNQAAPDEEEVEIYVDKQKSYIELENQGIYRTLLPSDTLIYDVKWYIRRLPSNIQSRIGNNDLIEYVRGVIR
jgi:hypothetical protein